MVTPRKQQMLTKKLIHFVVVLFIALSFAGVSKADVDCEGVPIDVRVWAQADNWMAIYLEGHPGPWLLCKFDEPFGGISPERCKSIYAGALSAMTTSKPVLLMFNDYTNCADIPAWSNEVPSKLWSVVFKGK